jgi:GNAT superfamily N-acetyltransferase
MLTRHELAALEVTRVPRQDADRVVDVLCESFRDYPVMRFVLGEEGDYDARLQRMIGLFVASRTLLDDVIFGISDGGELIAVATTSDPARPPHPDFAARRDAVWAELGTEAAARYQQCVRAWDSMASAVPQLHVNMLGVRKAYRTLGLGGRLLTAVHALRELNPRWQGVSLTTEDPRNVTFYQHHGYQAIGNARISPVLEAWSFMRWR